MTPAFGRRAFTTGALALAAAPLAASAQQQGRMPRIAFLAPEQPYAGWQFVIRGLADLGYIEGKSIAFDYFVAPTIADLPQFAAKAIAARPDAIVSGNTPSALAAKAATASIPIVLVGVGAAVEVGLIASLARPGGNVTGLSTATTELWGKNIQMLKEIMPGLSTLAVFIQPADQTGAVSLAQIEAAAKTVGIEILVVNARADNDMAPMFAVAVTAGAQAILLVTQSYFRNFVGRIAELGLQYRLPTVSNFRLLPEAGGLMHYGSQSQIFRRAAYYIDRILKGAKPADLPVEQPTKFEMVLNMKTAKALGLTIPLLVEAQADEIIE